MNGRAIQRPAKSWYWIHGLSVLIMDKESSIIIKNNVRCTFYDYSHFHDTQGPYWE